MNQAKFNHPPIPTDKDEAQKELDALLLQEAELVKKLDEVSNVDKPTQAQKIIGEVKPDEISHPIILHDTGVTDTILDENTGEFVVNTKPSSTKNTINETAREQSAVIEGNTETEETPVIQSNEELRKQLYEEMKKIKEMEEKLAQIEKEDKELEEFIAKQEEMEKLEQLKKKALEAIALGKKAGLSKKELLAKGFNALDIDEVFNSKKK